MFLFHQNLLIPSYFIICSSFFPTFRSFHVKVRRVSVTEAVLLHLLASGGSRGTWGHWGHVPDERPGCVNL